MKPEIIIMLTNNDITVKNAEEVFESCKDLPAKKWGFKDVGLPKDEMIKLAAKMKEAGNFRLLFLYSLSGNHLQKGIK